MPTDPPTRWRMLIRAVPRNLGSVEGVIGGCNSRHHREAEPDPADEECKAQEHEAGRGPDRRVGDRAQDDDDQSERNHPAGAVLVREPARCRHHECGPDSLRGDQKPGDQGTLSAVDLVVERQKDQGSEQRRSESEGGEPGRQKPLVLEELHVDQRRRSSKRRPPDRGLARVEHEGDDQSDPTTSGIAIEAVDPELPIWLNP